MASVTQRIKQIKQPYGGYLKPSEFKKIQLEDNNKLEEENIHSSLVGLVVDYMTRFANGEDSRNAFKISMMGANIINDTFKAEKILANIDGVNDKSIYYACKLVGYDVCYRAGIIGYKNVDEIEADEKTINNIKIMINRSINFLKDYGPIIVDGFTFEGGYTKIINAGDGDFLTEDTIWDFKVSAYSPKSSHTLQLLIYYIMGNHSIHEEFKNIKKLGIFNPRLNCIYIKQISEIPIETIEIVSKEIIGYDYINEDNTNSNSYHDNDLTVTDIMRILNCSRYMVMKYYAEKDLPLIKIKNKYYIKESELYNWIDWIEEEERKQFRKFLIFTAIFVFIGLIIIFTMFGSSFNKLLHIL